jgi:pimeloyl-ACP methyl ester carboxylesterase
MLYGPYGHKGRTMTVTSFDNTSIYYEVNGTGNTLLLLHGFSNDHTIWDDTGLVKKLQRDYTVITIDI